MLLTEDVVSALQNYDEEIEEDRGRSERCGSVIVQWNCPENLSPLVVAYGQRQLVCELL